MAENLKRSRKEGEDDTQNPIDRMVLMGLFENVNTDIIGITKQQIGKATEFTERNRRLDATSHRQVRRDCAEEVGTCRQRDFKTHRTDREN